MNELSDDDIYSAWKFVHHRERIEAIRWKRPIIPANIQIDLEGRCDHHCRFCAYREAGFDEIGMQFNEPVRIPRERALRLADEIQELGIPSVEITGGGESMLYPWIGDFLERLGPTELAIVTNGGALTPEIVDRIHPTSPRWIRFSADSCTPDTHSRVHGVKKGLYPRILGHIEYVLSKGFPNCKVGVSFVIVPENTHEIVAAARFWKAFGAHNIRYSFTYDKDYQGRLSVAEREWVFTQLDLASQEQTADFKVFGWKSRLDNYAAGNHDFSRCAYQYGTVALGNDGGVWPCCIVKYYPAYCMGSIHTQSLREVLLGHWRRAYLEAFSVKRCPPCWLRDKNRLVEAILKGQEEEYLGERYPAFQRYASLIEPPHVNFP